MSSTSFPTNLIREASVFASAAALTIGACTVPVYEIYKCGHDPYWLDGLNILGAIGVDAVVIPHYDNAEGGHHDTCFCYLGERRLRLMEQELPADHYVLGVDEHTGVILNLEEGSAEVVGNHSHHTYRWSITNIPFGDLP